MSNTGSCCADRAYSRIHIVPVTSWHHSRIKSTSRHFPVTENLKPIQAHMALHLTKAPPLGLAPAAPGGRRGPAVPRSRSRARERPGGQSPPCASWSGACRLAKPHRISPVDIVCSKASCQERNFHPGTGPFLRQASQGLTGAVSDARENVVSAWLAEDYARRCSIRAIWHAYCPRGGRVPAPRSDPVGGGAGRIDKADVLADSFGMELGRRKAESSTEGQKWNSWRQYHKHL
jgi:hypothetical protein